jgi:quercetin dioxygenase-like cupin family protein
MSEAAYQVIHPDAAGEIVTLAEPEDERVWVPQADYAWFRPLVLDTRAGSFTDLLRVRGAGAISRHRHPAAVHGHVVRGQWHYIEHEWTASPGTCVYEPPGETHTLVVDTDDEMVTLFHNFGPVIYVDEAGNQTGYDDVFTKIDLCRGWYDECGLGADYLDQFIR